MNLFYLGIRSVTRKPVKSIILLLIVFVVASFLYAGWTCKNASVQTQNSGKQAVGASFRLEGNETNKYNRRMELSSQIGNVSGSAGGYHQEQLPNGSWLVTTDNSFETLLLEDIEKISAVEGIAGYNVTTINTVVNPVNFQRIEDIDVDQNADLLGVSLRGNLNMEYDSDVQRGSIVVTEGRMVSPGDVDVCVVSRELAELNGLTLGDIMAFNNRKDPDNSIVYEATIIGIYESIQYITPVMSGDSYRSENIIFTDLRFPEKAEGNEDDPFFQYATFWVADVNEYDVIKSRIQEVDIAWERYDLLDNTGMSDTMAENFKNLSSMSSLLLIFVIISSTLILSFVFLFWMKNRTREMGILLSIGRSKWQIVMQVLMESVLVSTIGFCLATAVAPVVSQGTANYLVGYQVQLEEEKEQAESGFVAASFATAKTEVLGVTAEIGWEIVLFSFGSTIGIIIISVLVSGIYVVIQKPREILSKMS